MKFGCFGSFTVSLVASGSSRLEHHILDDHHFFTWSKGKRKENLKKETFLMTIITSLPDIDDHHHFSTRSLMTTIISSPDLWLPPSSLHQIYSVSNSSDGSSAQLRQEFQTQTVLTLVLLVHAAIFLAGIIAMLSSGSSESSSSWWPDHVSMWYLFITAIPPLHHLENRCFRQYSSLHGHSKKAAIQARSNWVMSMIFFTFKLIMKI